MVWTLTGEPSPQLFEAGRVLHWALQVPAAFAATLASQEDDSHEFRWRAALGALSSGACPNGYRAGLRLHDLTLLLFKDEALYSKYPLAGKTLEQGYGWLTDKLVTHGQVPALRPTYALPPHAVAAGAPFPKNELYRELAKWYGNAATVLEEVRALHKGALPVRCRPHTFDIAARLEPGVPTDKPGAVKHDGTPWIDVGMTPGDAAIAEPYWYVAPRPAPPEAALPSLDDGHWHTEGRTGAVLRAADLTTASADAQALQVETFLKAAVAASYSLLETLR